MEFIIKEKTLTKFEKFWTFSIGRQIAKKCEKKIKQSILEK